MRKSLDGCLKGRSEDITAMLDLAGIPRICHAKDVEKSQHWVDLVLSRQLPVRVEGRQQKKAGGKFWIISNKRRSLRITCRRQFIQDMNCDPRET